jgi:hypothetical protein
MDLLLDTATYENLREEYRQAWDHYRHVEAERDQRINYFFTITLAVVGFSIAITGTSLNGNGLLLSIAAAATVYTWVAISLHLDVMTFGIVLGHYLNVIQSLRAVFYQSQPDEVREFVESLDVGRSQPMRGLIKSRYHGVQRSAQAVLAFLTGIALLTDVSIVVVVLVRAPNWWPYLVIGYLQLAMAIGGIAVWLSALRAFGGLPSDDTLRKRLAR